MRPGDLVVFHGVIGGERGTCLVISIEPLQDSPLRFWAFVLANDTLLRVLQDRLDEDISWSRINSPGAI